MRISGKELVVQDRSPILVHLTYSQDPVTVALSLKPGQTTGSCAGWCVHSPNVGAQFLATVCVGHAEGHVLVTVLVSASNDKIRPLNKCAQTARMYVKLQASTCPSTGVVAAADGIACKVGPGRHGGPKLFRTDRSNVQIHNSRELRRSSRQRLNSSCGSAYGQKQGAPLKFAT